MSRGVRRADGKEDGWRKGGGRERQRRRTRRAIVEAAELLKRGADPSVTEVAEAADVSRRSVYAYFPTLGHLLADAALEASRQGVEPRFEAGTPPTGWRRSCARSSRASPRPSSSAGRSSGLP